MRKGHKIIISTLFLWSFTPDAECQQAISGTWAKDTSNGFIEQGWMTTDVVNGKIYVIPGSGFQLQVFDPTSHVWSTPATIGSFTSADITSGVIGGKIYTVGLVFQDSIRVDSLKVFDPSNNSWNSIATIGSITPRQSPGSSVVDGKLYVMGGWSTDYDSVLNDVNVFDPVTQAWTKPIRTGNFKRRTEFTSAVVNGKIYVIGGSDLETFLTQDSALQVFDPATNTWTTPVTKGTFTPRANLSSCVLNGLIYTIGGQFAVPPVGTLEVFDPSSNQWSPGPPMPTARHSLSSCVVDGRIYALGGYTPHTTLNTVEVFTPGPPDEVSSAASASPIVLSPNPTDGLITLHADNTKHITIENLLGNRVLEVGYPRSPEFTLDLSKLPAGLYFARFEMEGTVIMRKIVKE